MADDDMQPSRTDPGSLRSCRTIAIGRDPASVARYATSLFDTGGGSIGNFTVTAADPPPPPPPDQVTILAFMSPDRPLPRSGPGLRKIGNSVLLDP